MMRRSAGFDADKARRQLLKEWYDVPALELTANDYITCRVNSVDLKNRLRDIETDCRDRLHVWLLRIVGVSTAPTSMALPCRWRSRPQHQKRTFASQQKSSLFESRPPERGASRSHRTINAGTLQWVSTSYAWLPSNSRETPRRPCDAMTIKSHPFPLAVATIPSAGC